MAHSHHMHREHQVSHRRVHHLLKGEPAGSTKHHKSHAFSKVTSKTAAEHHDGKVSGHKGAKRHARGGKVHPDEAEDKKLIKKMINQHDAGKFARGGRTKKHSAQTNIAIVMPSGNKGNQPTPVPIPMPPPGAGGPPPGGPPPGGPPPGAGGPPPGMPMRARGGKVIDGESSRKNIKEWSHRAKSNSYARGGRLPDAGAQSGVARKEQFHHFKGKK